MLDIGCRNYSIQLKKSPRKILQHGFDQTCLYLYFLHSSIDSLNYSNCMFAHLLYKHQRMSCCRLRQIRPFNGPTQVHFIITHSMRNASLVPRPLPTRGEGPGTHRLRMRHFIRRFSVKLSVYSSLPHGDSIACSNRYQGKSFCFRWPANCLNTLFELASCVPWPYASRKKG